MISTDKAVNPTNIMGATKRAAEMVIAALGSKYKTEFVSVRFGNVLGSHGSVVPLFERMIRAGGPVTVMHPDIVRYFMTIPEAASLVLQAAVLAKGGELFVLDMGQPVLIRELAERMIQLYAAQGGQKQVEIVYTGLRPGDKLYEELLTDDESLVKTELDKIYVTKPDRITETELTQMLQTLEDCMVSRGDMRACLHSLIPSFREADEVNGQTHFERIMDHERYMRAALQEAEQAAAEGEVPVGAVIVHGGEILARTHNRREQLHDPTAHAEILAIREAAEKLGSRRLTGCTLYVTLEPCPMCAGAMVMANLDACCFGANDEQQGCVESVYALASDPAFYHRVRCVGGLLEPECRELLQTFFQTKR